ncbi:hypothetical protein BH10BDE1_BH10BDE1_16010 [soil metagenome]
MNFRNLLGLSAVVATLAAANIAQALPDVCTMANTEVKGVRASAEDIAAYKAKLAAECELSEKYQQMQNKAKAKYGITLEQITQFQAMRYVRRADYNSAKANNITPNLTYQIFDEQYKKPETKDTKIWDGFLKGIESLSYDRERIQAGGRFELNDLLRVHRNFYQVSDERGDHANVPNPGIMKTPNPNDGPWWPLKPEVVATTTKTVDEINDAYGELDLVQTGLAGLYETAYMNQLISVKPVPNGTGYGLYGGDSRGNGTHIQNLLKFVNNMLSQARTNGVMVRKGHLMTPGEVAYLAQQYVVQVHPFQDGNGRVTRYLQELILTSFGEPVGSSGDLMENDVLTPNPAYYAEAISATKSLLTSVDECLEKNYVAATHPASLGAKSGGGRKGESAKTSEAIPLSSIDSSTIDYDCRLLK